MTNIYRLALQVQDASNPNGVVNSLANEIMPGIRDEAGYREQGTSYITSHPAFILFLDKLASMTPGCYLNDMGSAVQDAYTECYAKQDAVSEVQS